MSDYYLMLLYFLVPASATAIGYLAMRLHEHSTAAVSEDAAEPGSLRRKLADDAAPKLVSDP
jgi:hypothetical protein